MCVQRVPQQFLVDAKREDRANVVPNGLKWSTSDILPLSVLFCRSGSAAGTAVGMPGFGQASIPCRPCPSDYLRSLCSSLRAAVTSIRSSCVAAKAARSTQERTSDGKDAPTAQGLPCRAPALNISVVYMCSAIVYKHVVSTTRTLFAPRAAASLAGYTFKTAGLAVLKRARRVTN